VCVINTRNFENYRNTSTQECYDKAGLDTEAFRKGGQIKVKTTDCTDHMDKARDTYNDYKVVTTKATTKRFVIIAVIGGDLRRFE